MEMAQHKCSICLQFSTETISIYDQVVAGVSYLDITWKLTNELELGESRDTHICVPCANTAKTAYNFEEPCEVADCKLEIKDEIFIEEKVEAVKIEDVNVITSNYRDHQDSSYTSTEDNNVILLNQIKVEPADENTRIEGVNAIFLKCETENTESVSSNCSIYSLKEETNIVNESEQALETSLENKNDNIEIYYCKLCDKPFHHRNSLRRHSKVVHKLDKLPCDYCEYIPESPSDYVKHAEAEHADKRTKRCNHCGKTFFDIRTLKLHLPRHSDTKNYVCKVCGSKFALKNHLAKHLRRHEQIRQLNCSECGESYTLTADITSKKCEACKDKVGQAAWTAFACKICDKTFSQRSSLRRHNKDVHNLHQTSCYYCDFLPQSSDELTNHIANKHADRKSLACKDCGKTFFELRILKAHLLVHKNNHLCNICGDTFSSKFKLMEHVRRHTGELQFSCFKCDKMFLHSSSLRRHKKIHESDSSDEDKSDSGKGSNLVAQEALNIYVCKMCNKRFKQRSSLRRHSKNIHNILEISCYFCEYKPESSSDLAKHTEKEHADKKNFACNQCDKSFFEIKDLNVHLRVHGGIKNYECENCNYKCIIKSDLIKHMRTHSEEKPFKCSDCNKAFKQHYSLKNHLANQMCNVPIKKSHEAIPRNSKTWRNYSCKLCDRKFSKRSSVRAHTKIVHKINQLSCLFCDYVPDSSSDLRKHTDKEHADKKTISCEHCDKTFLDLGNLRSHLIVHNTVKNYVCKLCGYKFTMESCLTEHMAIHTGEKPFKCCLCDSSFRLHAGLKKHISTHSDLTK